MIIQQNRLILISGAISVVLGFLAGFLGGQLAAPPSRVKPAAATVQAERFQLADAQGRTRGRLEVDPQGWARLVLSGQDGAPWVSLGAGPQGGTLLQMGDENRQRTLLLQTDPQGFQTISLYHDGQVRLALEVQKNGDAALNLNDHGKRLATLGLTRQEEPHLTFSGENQKVVMEITSKNSGDRHFTLAGKDGIPRIVLGLKHDQKAALGLFDRKGKTRVALLDEPALFLLKNGRVVRTLP
jgi:hypothetical protein